MTTPDRHEFVAVAAGDWCECGEQWANPIHQPERRAHRYDQCDDTCTVDCGHCKGQPATDAIHQSTPAAGDAATDVDTAALREVWEDAANSGQVPLPPGALVDILRLCDSLDAMTDERDEWADDVADAHMERTEWDRRLTAAESERDAARGELVTARGENQQLRDAWSRSQNSNRELRAERSALTDAGVHMSNRIAELSADRAAANARIAAVQAELTRRKECAAAERAAGRSCDYCEDFIPEIAEILAGVPAAGDDGE